jgi:hypothetical protein
LIPAPAEVRRLPRHHYTLLDVLLFVRLVLASRTPLRCAGRVPAIVAETCGISLGTPHWTTGRLWLLRLGLFKLTRPKAIADDWVWLVDHSVQVGTTKCLLVLGIRLSAMPPAGQPLRHEDLEPIELLPVENSTQETVCAQLESAVAKTGVPRVILDDHGSDLHGGVKLFQQRHPRTIEIYDVTHKAARLLKRRLEHDPRWTEFCRHVGQTRRQIQQTPLACLLPPTVGDKARFMNLGPLIRWGVDTLRVLDQPPAPLTQQAPAETRESRLGWLRDYAAPLREWSQFTAVIDTTLDFVRGEGLTPQSGAEVRDMLDALCLDPPARTLAIELAAFVRDESAKAAPGERLPGSTEVLESCFGKLKALEQHHSRSGFTNLILTLGALVSDTTADIVAQALEAVPTKRVWDWCRTTLGTSVQSLRNLVYHSSPTPETKPG